MSTRDVVGTLVTRVALIAAGLLSSVITARYLGPEGRGEFFYWSAVAAFVVQFGNAGLHASNAYLLTKRGAPAGVLSVNSLIVSLLAGCALVLLALPLLAASGQSWGLLGSRSVALMLLAVGGLFTLLGSNLLVALGRIGEFNLVELVSRYGSVLVLLLAAWLWRDVHHMLLALGLASIGSAAFVLWRLQAHAPLGRPSAAVLRDGMGYGLRAYLAACLGMVVARTNAFLLEPLVPASEYGTWSIAMQFFDVINVVPTSLALVLFPRILRSDEPHRLLLPQILLVTAMLIAVLLGFIVLGPWVIRLLYGPSFDPAYRHLLWALPGALGFGITSILSQYLAAKGFPWSLVLVWLVVAAVQALAAWMLIPWGGADGAMASLSVAYVLTAMLVGLLAVRIKKRNP